MTKKFLVPIVLIAILAACTKEPPVPKPKTYLRLTVPQPEYLHYNSPSLPFEFDYPDYGQIIPLESDNQSNKWFNIVFNRYGFEANVSYIPLKTDTSLTYMVNDCYTFLDRHKKFSSGILEREYANAESKVYGTAFEILGSDVVSPYQLFVTDSSRHFVRLALHCQSAPNNDSLAVVIERLKTDINHMVSTIRWK